MTFLKNPGLFPGQSLAEFEGGDIQFNDLEYFGNLVFQTILPKVAAVHRVHLFPAGSNPPNHVNGLKIAVDFNLQPAEIAADILSKIGSFASKSFHKANEFAQIYSGEKEFSEAIYAASRMAGEYFIKSRFSGLSKYLSINRGLKYQLVDKANDLGKETGGKKYSPEQFLEMLAYVSGSGEFPSVYSGRRLNPLEDCKGKFWNWIYSIGRGNSYFDGNSVDSMHALFEKIVEFPENGDDGDGQENPENQSGSSGKGKSPDKPDGKKGDGDSDSESSGGGKGDEDSDEESDGDGDESGDEDSDEDGEESDGDGKDSDEDGDDSDDEESDGDGDSSDEDSDEDDSEPEHSTGGGISFSNGDENDKSGEGIGIPDGNVNWRKVPCTPKPPEDEALKLAAILRPRFSVRKAKLEVVGAGYVDRRMMAQFQFPYKQNVVAEGNQSALAAMICVDGSGSMAHQIEAYVYGKPQVTRFSKSIIAAQAIALAMKNGDQDADIRYLVFDDEACYSENNNTDLLFAQYFPNGNTTFMFLPEVTANFKGEVIVITDGEGRTPEISDFPDTTARNRIHFIRIGDDFEDSTRQQLMQIAKSVVYCANLSELPALIATAIRPANV